MPREITIDWTTINGAGKTSVMYFGTGATTIDQRQAIADWLTNLDGALDTTTSWVVNNSGRVWDDTTGALVGAWSEGTSLVGTGTVSGEPVADATQLLYQWHTPNIVGGRFLVGRTFIPGMARINEVNGNMEEALRAALEGVAQDFVDEGVEFGIWHRPKSGAGGAFHHVTAASVWTELAVLRRRRH